MNKKTTSTEVAVKNENKLTLTQLSTEWGVETGPSKDMVIPQILIMQGLSDLVAERKAIMGDFMDSVSGTKIGSIDAPIKLIPFHVQKAWSIYKGPKNSDTREYVETIPLIENPNSPDYNDNLQYEEVVGQEVVKRVRRLNFFVLRPEEIEAGTAMPYVLAFKSTGLKEGKKLYTQAYIRNARAGLPPAQYVFELGGNMVKNDKGSFIVPSVNTNVRASTPEEISECLSWLKVVRGNASVKVDEPTEKEVSSADGQVEF